MKDALKTPVARTTAVIFLCFLLTSTGWLSWEYHLMDQIPSVLSDVSTMVAGYVLQAAGIGIFAVLSARWPAFSARLVPAALILHFVFMIPAVISPFAAGTLVFGFLMNLVCGMIAGYYLSELTVSVPEERKAAVFGIGYALAILASWLLSVIGGGAIYYSQKVLIITAVLTAASAAIVLASEKEKKTAADAEKSQEAAAKESAKPVTEKGRTDTGKGFRSAPVSSADRKFLLLAGLLVLLFSIVNSSGFAFPSSDLSGTVNVEFSRLVYAIGLVAAGLLTDKNRKYGAVSALAALMIPFIILALRGETVSSVIFWVLSYFTFGFYSVYRIVLFSDLAAKKRLYYLSGFGLLAGRLGDAAGEALCIALGNFLTLRVIVTAVLFVVSVVVFFRVYHTLYMPEVTHELSEREKFYQFCIRHDFSAREKDLVQLLLEEKTNGEIAEALSISENTVKFHVRNILQKTGCRNRKELIASYFEENA